MSNRKLIFFDIDGTLLNHEKKLPLATKHAIDQLHKTGHTIAIATGRGPFMYETLRDQLNINSFVSFNGSYVVLENKVISTHSLNKERLLDLVGEGLRNNHPAVLLDEAGMGANVISHPAVNESMATLKLGYLPSYDPDYHHGRSLYQTLLFCSEPEETYYQEKYPEFEFVRWHPLSVDVLPTGGSKANGIEAMRNALNIATENVYAFGDGLNDLEMLKTVENSVAMGNAVPEVKKVAKYITKDVENDGLAHGLKMLGLI